MYVCIYIYIYHILEEDQEEDPAADQEAHQARGFIFGILALFPCIIHDLGFATCQHIHNVFTINVH